MNADATRRDTGPYVGLEPLQARDRPYLKGRDADQRVVIANLRTASLTILYGAAGVGKSSLLLAGVVPHLHEEFPRTPVVVFRDWVGADPSRRLARACIDAAWSFGSQRARPSEEAPLDDVLRACAEAAATTVLVLLDQFEDYLQHHPKTDAPESFEVQFACAVNRDDVDAGFLIAVREASLSKLDRFHERIPQLLANSLRLNHLDEAGAREAIGQPVLDEWNRHHPDEPPMSIEEALVTQVINDAQADLARGEHGAQGVATRSGVIEAPFLQLVMARVWQTERARKPPSQVLRLATLLDRNELGGAKLVVRSHLDAVMNRLDAPQQAVCAAFFEHLVTPSGEKVPCNVTDLERWAGPMMDAVAKTLQMLSDGRILRTIAPDPRLPDQMRYEIFHEVFAPSILDWKRHHDDLRASELADEESRRAVREARLRARAKWVVWFGAAAVFAVAGAAAAVVLYLESLASRDALKSMVIAAGQPGKALELAADAAERTPWFRPNEVTEAALRLAVQPPRLLWTQLFAGRAAGVAFAPSGQTLITREVDERKDAPATTLRAWNIAQQRPEPLVGSTPLRLAGTSLTGRILTLPDGQTAVANAGSDAWVWRFGTPNTPPWQLAQGAPIGTALAVGKACADEGDAQPRVAVAGGAHGSEAGRVVNIWRAGPGEPTLVRQIDVAGAWLMGLTFSLDGCRLAGVAVERGKLPTFAAIWDTRSGKRLAELPMPTAGDAIAFSPDGTHLAVAGRDMRIRLMAQSEARGDSPWNQVRELIGHIERVRDVSFSADGTRLASAGGDKTVIVWDVATGNDLLNLTGHENYVETVAFGPGGEYLASGSRDRKLKLWNLSGHTGAVHAFAFHPDPKQLHYATAGGDRSAKLWDGASVVPQLLQCFIGHKDAVHRVAFDPRSRFVATASFDSTVRLWDPLTGRQLHELRGHQDQLRDIAFSADGRMLATAGADNRALLFDLEGDAPRLVADVQPGVDDSVQVLSVVFDPWHARWATADSSAQVRLWDMQGKAMGAIPPGRHYQGATSGARRIAFTRGGEEIAVLVSRTVYFYPTARFVENRDAGPTRMTEIEGGRLCEAMDLSADGRWMGVGCNDGVVRVFQRQGDEFVPFRSHGAHRKSVLSLAFSPDSKLLGSAGADHRFLVSPVTMSDLLALARRQLGDLAYNDLPVVPLASEPPAAPVGSR